MYIHIYSDTIVYISYNRHEAITLIIPIYIYIYFKAIVKKYKSYYKVYLLRWEILIYQIIRLNYFIN